MDKSRIFQNAKWIIICKIVQSVLQLIIGMITARYLGPSNYGLISYASSVVAFAIPVMQLGLRATLVQEFVENPDKEGEIIATSLVMNLVSAVACIISITVFTSFVNAGETETIVVCILYSFSLLFQAIEMIQYWFQYKLLSKYTSIMMLVAYMVLSIYKIYILISEKSIYWFTISHSIEYCVIGISLIFIYLKVGKQRFSFSFSTAKKMFSRSKYYIVSSLMVTVFANTDHVMLKLMIGDVENGYYSAAITCASVVSFVYQAIIDSARPVILSSKKNNQLEFERNMSRLYSIIIYAALIQSLGFTFFAKLIVFVLYGEEYVAAISVLRILVWYTAFSYMGTVRNIWILAEGKQSVLWIINLSGALFNIILNFFMIPLWGACGAALASVLTQFFTNFIIGFVLKPIHDNNKLILNGLNPQILREVIKMAISTR